MHSLAWRTHGRTVDRPTRLFSAPSSLLCRRPIAHPKILTAKTVSRLGWTQSLSWPGSVGGATSQRCSNFNDTVTECTLNNYQHDVPKFVITGYMNLHFNLGKPHHPVWVWVWGMAGTERNFSRFVRGALEHLRSYTRSTWDTGSTTISASATPIRGGKLPLSGSILHYITSYSQVCQAVVSIRTSHLRPTNHPRLLLLASRALHPKPTLDIHRRLGHHQPKAAKHGHHQVCRLFEGEGFAIWRLLDVPITADRQAAHLSQEAAHRDSEQGEIQSETKIQRRPDHREPWVGMNDRIFEHEQS